MKDDIFDYDENYDYDEELNLMPLLPGMRLGLSSNRKKEKPRINVLHSDLQGYSLERSPSSFVFEPRVTIMEVGYEKKDISCYFLRVPVDLFLNHELSLTDVLVYSRIYDLSFNNHSAYQNGCWANNGQIGEAFLFSPDVVRRSVDRLKKMNFVEEKRKYSLNPGTTRLLLPQKHYFVDEDGKNQQFFCIYYGLFTDPRLSKELICLYSYLYLQGSNPSIRKYHQGCFIFSAKVESKELPFSERILLKYIDEMNKLGLISVYKKHKSPTIIRPIFNFHDFFKTQLEIRNAFGLSNLPKNSGPLVLSDSSSSQSPFLSSSQEILEEDVKDESITHEEENYNYEEDVYEDDEANWGHEDELKREEHGFDDDDFDITSIPGIREAEREEYNRFLERSYSYIEDDYISEYY